MRGSKVKKMNNKVLQILILSIVLILVACGSQSDSSVSFMMSNTKTGVSTEKIVFDTLDNIDPKPQATNPPDDYVIKTIEIAHDLIRIVRMDLWHLGSDRNSEASITIMTEYGAITQEITGMRAAFLTVYYAPIEKSFPNPRSSLNFRFVDYNNDGYLDMALRKCTGGSMGNDPHYFWFWNTESEQFVRNYLFEDISNTSTISVMEDDTLRISSRVAWGHYYRQTLWTTNAFIDGVLTTTEEGEFRMYDDDRRSLFITPIFREYNPTQPRFTIRMDYVDNHEWIDYAIHSFYNEVHITVFCNDSEEILQEIDVGCFDITDYWARYTPLRSSHFRLLDYNGDDNLDIAFWIGRTECRGGSLDFYWLWDSALQKFVLR